MALYIGYSGSEKNKNKKVGGEELWHLLGYCREVSAKY